MKHTLRKYLSSRGSALFMVLSTMTALLIVVMAMYFSVVSSRSVQYAVFNQEQSYQSSISVADAVIAGLNDGKLDKLSSEFFKLKIGETKSTEGNGFASLAGTGKDDDPNIGAYDVTVTRLNDEGEYYVYDFIVTAMVNGVTETTHTLVRLSAGKPTPPPAGKTFTATGYLPNENWVGLGNYYDEVHIDSEYCVLGLDGPRTFGDFTAAGSVEINNTGETSSGDVKASKEPKHWSVGGNLKISKEYAGYGKVSEYLNNGTAEEHTTLIVGGNLIIENDGHLDIPQYVDIYVIGDCYLGTISQNVRGSLFVGGSLYATGNLNSSGVPILITDNSSGYICLSNVDDVDTYSVGGWGGTNIHVELWGEPAEDTGFISKDKAIEKLNEAIGSNSYPKWVPEVKGGTPDDAIDIAFNSYNNGDAPGSMDRTDKTGRNVPKGRFVYEEDDLKYSEGHDSVTIGNIYDLAPMDGAPGVNDYYIIIDTGDKPENVFTVRLLANRNLDPGDKDVEAPASNRTDKYDPTEEGENETFMWRPYNGSPCDPADAGTRTYVLIKGKGTVIFDIPEDVTYQSTWADFVGHMNWFALLANGTNNGAPVINSREHLSNEVIKYVHKTCTGSHKCEYSQFKDGKKLEDGHWWCETHEYLIENSAEKAEDLIVDGICPCLNRVGRKEMASELSSLTGDFVSMDSTGTVIYPTTNAWFVSCHENAEIRMSTTKNNETLMYNTTFGFIYAPYMTFTAKSSGAEGGLRMAGGLIVSDLLLNDRYDYIYIAPEVNYSELLGDNATPLPPQGNRSWRKYGY